MPLVVKWPGVAASGSVTVTPVTIEDFFPTILEVARVECSSQRGALNNHGGVVELGPELAGRRFVPLLRGDPGGPDRPLFWHFPHAWGGLGRPTPTAPGIGATSAVRRGDWKLVYWHVDGRKELFNLAGDIGERHNLAEVRTRMTAELSSLLGGFLRETGAVLPT